MRVSSPLFFINHTAFKLFLGLEGMGRLEKMVDSPAGMAGFMAKYRIPPEVSLEYCHQDEILLKR